MNYWRVQAGAIILFVVLVAVLALVSREMSNNSRVVGDIGRSFQTELGN